ncbi:hypothetical protein V2J09_016032 [Rumex salicifolius]
MENKDLQPDLDQQQDQKLQLELHQQQDQKLQLELHQQQEEQLNYIEETVLKKRKSSEEWAIRRKQQLLEKKWQLKKDKKLAFKRAEEFIKEYRNKELDFVNMKHRSKRRRNDVTVNLGSKPIFVIRIQGKSDIHPQIKKTLYTLGLKRIYSGVFLRASAENLAVLQKVEPFVTYGYPDLQNVRALIQKKGSLKIDKEKVPLNDNNIIEQALGKYDILCLEDIINEIYTVGPKFKEVASALWPFTLISPEDDVLQGKKNPFNKGGDTGNREDRINELLTKINA